MIVVYTHHIVLLAYREFTLFPTNHAFTRIIGSKALDTTSITTRAFQQDNYEDNGGQGTTMQLATLLHIVPVLVKWSIFLDLSL